jgi:hypothetical protein
MTVSSLLPVHRSTADQAWVTHPAYVNVKAVAREHQSFHQQSRGTISDEAIALHLAKPQSPIS